jgi:hypothetical protein
MKVRVFSLLLLGVLAMAADNPFVGTWKLDVSKSKFSPGPPPQSATVTIGADNKVVYEGTDGKGQKVSWSYTAVDGANAMIEGLEEGASVFEMRKGDTVDHVWEMGKGKENGHGVLSKDGKTMTYTLRGTDAEGKKVSNKEIYEKQ